MANSMPYLKEYFESDQLTDFTIRSGEKSFKVHKIILAAHSKYFGKMLEKPWAAQQQCKETTANEIDLTIDGPDVVERIVKYMYGWEYINPSVEDKLLFDIKLYIAADKYDLQGLKREACKSFEVHVNITSSVLFFTAVREIYAGTAKEDGGLRDAVVRVSALYLPNLVRWEAFQDILQEVSGFSTDIVLKLGANPHRKSLTYRYDRFEPGR